MEKYDPGDTTVRFDESSMPRKRQTTAASSAPSDTQQGSHSSIDFFNRLKIEREIWVAKMYLQWCGGLEAFLFVLWLFLFFGLTESSVSTMVWMHLPHALRPAAMFWFLKTWRAVETTVERALFDAPEPVARLKRHRSMFMSLARPTTAIVVLTTFGSLLDIIHLFIRIFDFRTITDPESDPPRMWGMLFAAAFVMMDAYLWAWFYMLRYNVPKKYRRLVTKALRGLLGRGSPLEPPPPRAATEYDEEDPPAGPPTFGSFRHGTRPDGSDSDSDSDDDDDDSDGSGSGSSSDDDDDDEEGGGASSSTPSPKKKKKKKKKPVSAVEAAAAPTGPPYRPNASTVAPTGEPDAKGTPERPPPSATTPTNRSRNAPPAPTPPSGQARPKRLPPIGGRSKGPRGVFSPKGGPPPGTDASDPNDSGYLGNIPGPSPSPPKASRKNGGGGGGGAGDGSGAGGEAKDSGYHIDV